MGSDTAISLACNSMPLAGAAASTRASIARVCVAQRSAVGLLSGLMQCVDLQGLVKPNFSNHSLRRCADSQARRDMHNTENGRRPVTKDEIDLTFGWHEMELSKEMQLHYATLSLFSRLDNARITGLM